jgi:hypothetical protein
MKKNFGISEMLKADMEKSLYKEKPVYDKTTNHNGIYGLLHGIPDEDTRASFIVTKSILENWK